MPPAFRSGIAGERVLFRLLHFARWVSTGVARDAQLLDFKRLDRVPRCVARTTGAKSK
jgi:hypothetical protein